ncbi:hypothetical protein TRFO_16921 [Tritrichomonas foetus]|uniref:Uncharacterized protein n=1 Tax=Tritrichomonas foetus TaxID=1144522 RepID=A0A1J4KTI2_9EUKA|nr:hypothetical protein TRFO_16921 [Tritrichomonas foetus]|eukprot:OHT12974.1 hypothetical protein TRFO_16921 [Tritrichomonas foetus]
MFFFISTVLALDAKSVLVGTWAAYPGSARSYAPQLKYTFSFFENTYEERTYATAWVEGQLPSEGSPNPPASAFAGFAKIYFQTENRGLYIAGEDRHWRSFSFNDINGKKVCNVTTLNGYKVGIAIQSEKMIEYTLIAPNGTIVHQYLTFFKSVGNSTAIENYINKIHPEPAAQDDEYGSVEEAEDEEEPAEEVQREVPIQQESASQFKLSTNALILGGVSLVTFFILFQSCICCLI